ncbi:MAG: leucine-rich repeat protein [Bacteroidaceae bacterium]|nr:leucine-rich repeat protein [Bacteroidaceae bacterium]
MASDYEENGIRYTIDNSTKSASVTRYNSSVIAQNEGIVNIPETISFNGRTYSVTNIKYRAFKYCESLTSVTIGNSVTSIESEAFSDCTGLTSITIGNSVTSIGQKAFDYCRSLNNVHITDLASWCKISFAGADTFYRSYKLYLNGKELTDLIIPESITTIGERAFYRCTSLTSITIPSTVTSIGNYAFSGCTGLTSITIPSSVTSIGESAFYNCTRLTSITIPSSLTSIGWSAFYGCTGLTSITIGNSVTSIGGSAFYGCTGLTSITIGNSVTSIGRKAFYGCTGLTSITIPESVTSIESDAFRDCPNITIIYLYAVKPPSIINNPFDADVMKTKATLYVLPEAISAYQNHTYWKQFWIEEMDESMTGIENVKISSEENAPIYDLYGRRIIGKPQSGQIYIRNGKKTLAM